MALTIKQVFDKHCSHLVVNSNLIKAIKAYDLAFVTKNTDHISFFGSALLGVYPIKWLDEDRDRWIDDILGVDEVGLKDDVHELDSIDPNYLVTSDVVNLSFVYLLHRINDASGISEAVKKEGMLAVAKIMHYKYLSSLLSHYFPYPADESIAKATHASLSLKFDIKKYGSWGALIQKRAEDLVSRNSIHYDTIRYMRDDKLIQYVVSDTQSRIREVVKALTTVFYAVRDADGRVISTSSVLQIDEGIMIKDVKRVYPQFYRYIKDVIPDKDNFARREVVKVILDAVPAANPNAFASCLTYLSANYNDSRKKHIAEFVEECLLYSFEFMSSKKIKTNDFVQIITKLRAMYTGSRINDPTILKLRKLGDRIVKESVVRKSSVPTAPERTALLLYVLLRTLTMDHYK